MPLILFSLMGAVPHTAILKAMMIYQNLFPDGQINSSLELLIGQYSNSHISFDNMIVLTDKISPALADLLADCRMHGKYPHLFLIQPESKTDAFDNYALSRLKKSEIRYSIISDSKEFASALGGMK